MDKKEQIEKAAELHYTQITLAERTAFKLGVNWALSQPKEVDLQKPVESDAVEFAVHLIKADLDRPNRLEDELNQLKAEYIKFKQLKK